MSAKPASRRDFLKVIGITLGASTVLCAGLGYTATRTPAVETLPVTYGKDDPAAKRILVTYATRAGSTVEVAAAIAKTLAGRGFQVDVKPVKDKPSLEGYSAVLVGSAIRMGNWLPEAVDFLKTNQAALSGVPLALFTVHLDNVEDDEESRSKRSAYLDSVRPLVQATDEVFFAGKMDMARLSLFDRWMIQQMGGTDRDLRDWDKIRAWAEGVFA